MVNATILVPEREIVDGSTTPNLGRLRLLCSVTSPSRCAG